MYDVRFDNPFDSASYSISVVGETPRTWSILSKTFDGFTINSNSIEEFEGEVLWMAKIYED